VFGVLLLVGVGLLAYLALIRTGQPASAPAAVVAPAAPAPAPVAATTAATVPPSAPSQPTLPPAAATPPLAPVAAATPRPRASEVKPGQRAVAPSATAPPATRPVEAAAEPQPLQSTPVTASGAKAAVVAHEEALSFGDVKIVLADGTKTKENDILLTFADGRITALAEKGGSIIKAMPYQAIVSATYSQSKHPRWKQGLGVAVVAGVFSAPIFFMKSTRHWLTLQSKDDFMVLHLDKNNVNMILPAIQSRAGIAVQRVEGDK
jgi:hypothetical protein